MDDETWFNAKKAVELGFADSILYSGGEEEEKEDTAEALMFSRLSITNSLVDKLKSQFGKPKATQLKSEPSTQPKSGPSEEPKKEPEGKTEPQKEDNRVDAEPLKQRLFIISH